MPDEDVEETGDVEDVQEESEDVEEYDVERESYHTTYRSDCCGGLFGELSQLVWWFNRGAVVGLGLGIGYIIAKTVFE